MTAKCATEAIKAAQELADSSAAAHVFTLRLDLSARAEAEAADRAREQGDVRPLLGVPVTVKDNFDLAGLPTTAGSILLKGAPPAESDAPVVVRLRQAGCVILGRTNMTEFAFSGLGLNPHHGTPANPAIAGREHIPGGSSSGAAVSVALCIARIAIGTDTGGSVRIPAAFCGLVGFKPTADTITRMGVLPLSTTLDCVGIIANDVADCVAMFDAIRDHRPAQPTISPGRPRLAVVASHVGEGLDPEVAATFGAAISRLAAAGYAIDHIDLAELSRIPEMLSRANFATAEAWQWHEPHLGADSDGKYDPRVLARIRLGADMNADAIGELHQARMQLIRDVEQATAGYDALLWPTTPCTAPSFASLIEDEAYYRENARILRNSTVANLLDIPAISVPCATEGKPVGLTIAGKSMGDDALLAIASELFPIIGGHG